MSNASLHCLQNRLESLFSTDCTCPELNIDGFRSYEKDTKIRDELDDVDVMDWVSDEAALGYNGKHYSRMALFVVADYIAKKRDKVAEEIDYKCYSADAPTGWKSVILPEEGRMWVHDAMENIESTIRAWVNPCMKEWAAWRRHGRTEIFRRSMLVVYRTDFVKDSQLLALQNCITTLAFEQKRGGPFRILIYDYRLREHRHPVHEQLFGLIKSAMCASEGYRQGVGKAERLVMHTETVCLKGKLHYDYQFMMGLSIAHRVCMYLSWVRDCVEDIVETKADFETDTRAIKGHAFRMANFLLGKSKDYLAVISAPMTEPAFVVEPASCYLMLVPREEIKRYNMVHDMGRRHWVNMFATRKDLVRLVFDERNGLRVSNAKPRQIEDRILEEEI